MFTEKMNAGFDDDEFAAVDVEYREDQNPISRAMTHHPNSLVPKPSEFKS